jgi:hypothetical protein
VELYDEKDNITLATEKLMNLKQTTSVTQCLELFLNYSNILTSLLEETKWVWFRKGLQKNVFGALTHITNKSLSL